ncbi:hypothetical protein D3C81_2313340 [compost metagenome]
MGPPLQLLTSRPSSAAQGTDDEHMGAFQQILPVLQGYRPLGMGDNDRVIRYQLITLPDGDR